MSVPGRTCTSATLPYANYLPYVVSKGAAKQLMRALAIELAPEVRVNAVAPTRWCESADNTWTSASRGGVPRVVR